MRQLLNGLYRASGGLAAVFMVGTLMMVAIGITGRLAGFYVRGTDDYAGYCMAACGFLALAYTFKHREHIRVTILLDRLPGTMGRILEWISLAASATVAAALAWFSVRLVWQSYQFHDVSQGVDATPLWIPQLGMALGTAIFLVALLDDLVLRTLGRPASHLKTGSSEPARSE